MSKNASETSGEELTHAGGVVYRETGTYIEYLLVRPHHKTDEWVLPKGHIEPHEQPADTAIREVREETGVVANVLASIEVIEFELGGQAIRAKFFLMKFVSPATASEVREIKWAKYQEALNLLTHAQSRHLLESAETMRRSLDP